MNQKDIERIIKLSQAYANEWAAIARTVLVNKCFDSAYSMREKEMIKFHREMKALIQSIELQNEKTDQK